MSLNFFPFSEAEKEAERINLNLKKDFKGVYRNDEQTVQGYYCSCYSCSRWWR